MRGWLFASRDAAPQLFTSPARDKPQPSIADSALAPLTVYRSPRPRRTRHSRPNRKISAVEKKGFCKSQGQPSSEICYVSTFLVEVMSGSKLVQGQGDFLCRNYLRS